MTSQAHHSDRPSGVRRRLLSESGVIVRRRDPHKPVTHYRPVIHVTQPISIAELLDDDDPDPDTSLLP